ncbi:MAG: hypothetical protein HC897_08185 [Thermoanaerobaculia bacterium]|nr:hypothetical protein [Thermoanaerobaculia bacterium]
MLGEQSEAVFARPEIADAHFLERDWGANLVARELSRALGLGCFLRVNLARVVLDFGRFPGASGHGVEYLLRKAIYPPIEGLLEPEVKHDLINNYYYRISDGLTRQVADKILLLDVHTYDARNGSGTDRPEISLINRSLEYQQTSTIPPYLYDPLFPAHLCESTCDRELVYELLLGCQRAGWHVTKNYPYAMPAGSVEIRAQVWFFFRYLRQRFSAAFPETRDQPAYQRVWDMVLDVTRRSCDAQSLRGYLHRFREAQTGAEDLFAEARNAYREIRRFVEHDGGDVAREYTFAAGRPSCLGIEVRKDVLCHLDRAKNEVRLRDDAEKIARQIAAHFVGPVAGYLERVEPSVASARYQTASVVAG